MNQSNEQTIWQGTNCGVRNAGEYVARTQEEWTKIWDAVQSASWPAKPAPRLPEGMMAVCIFTGQQSSPATIAIQEMSANRAGPIITYSIDSVQSMLAVMHENYLLQFVPAAGGDFVGGTVQLMRVQPPRPVAAGPKRNGPHGPR